MAYEQPFADHTDKTSYLIENAMMKVNPHGLLLTQVHFKNIQLAAVEPIWCLLQGLSVCLSLHSFFSLPVAKKQPSATVCRWPSSVWKLQTTNVC